MTGPEVTIPTAPSSSMSKPTAIGRSSTIGELYSCRHEVFVAAVNAAAPPLRRSRPRQRARRSTQQGKAAMEPLDSSDYALLRAKVPGGWLVVMAGASVTFTRTPKSMDGSSLV